MLSQLPGDSMKKTCKGTAAITICLYLLKHDVYSELHLQVKAHRIHVEYSNIPFPYCICSLSTANF